MHRNELELLQLKIALKTIFKGQELHSLHIQMDNIVALTYFHKMGVTKNPEMVCIFKKNWKLLLRKKVTATADYLPSALNKHAGIEFRRKTCSSEWKLASSLFQRLCVKLGKSLIDVFVPRVSHQILTYVNWKRSIKCGSECILNNLKQGVLLSVPSFLPNNIDSEQDREGSDKTIGTVKCNTIGVHRSAILSYLEKIEDMPVVQHPIVTSLLAGIFNSRPPQPRYNFVWDFQVF